MKAKSKKLGMQIAVIIGVVILPLMYSYFYLGAFWDPYATLDSLPVAVVNNDKGASIDGKDRNLGTEFCDKLKANSTLKFVVTDQDDAKTGTEGKKYYATITVPSNFSANIASASQENKQTAEIVFSPNEKRNFLASQILSKATLQMEETLRSEVNEEIVQELSGKLKTVPSKLGDLQNGLGELYDGSSALNTGFGKLNSGISTLKSGTSTLAKGSAEFSSSFNKFADGISAAKTGSDKLGAGAGKLDKGITDLLAGATKLESSTTSLNDLHTNVKDLADGAAALNVSLGAYIDGVDALIANVKGTSQFITMYVSKYPPQPTDTATLKFLASLADPANQENIQKLSGASAKLKGASQLISSGLALLSDGTKDAAQVHAGILQIKQGLQEAKDGSAQVADGSKSLNSGLATLDSSAELLNAASKKLSSGAAAADAGAGSVAAGANTLGDGAKKLQDGVSTAKDGVTTSVNDANKELKSLDGLDTFASKPVSVKQESINAVPNYGTAFAPYFLSLSLWVGAIIIFVGIYLDSDSKFKVLSRDSDKKIVRSFIYLLIGFTQAIVLGVILKLVLGLTVNHLVLFFLACCLVSVVFLSIVQFLMVFLKDLGKFLSLVLLILQLTSCGGTFPMETVPKFFGYLYPFMPMTYSVNLFKETISGGDSGAMLYNTGILLGILVVFMVLTVVFSLAKKNDNTSKTTAPAVKEKAYIG